MQFELHNAVWFFWTLPIVFVTFLFVERRRTGILSRFVARTETAAKLPEYAPSGPWWQCAFFLAALLFLGVALLKPYSGFEMREIARKGVDLFFLVDVSPSMLAEDIKPSRIDRARFELKDFLAELTGDRVGLIGFSGESFTLVPLTGDDKAFELFLNELDPGLFPVAGTDIPGAVAKAVASFKKESTGAGKAIILITDGEDSVGLDASVIDDIKKYGVKVFVIGVGTTEGAPISEEGGGYKTDSSGNVVVTRLNEPALQNLAVATGGGYVRSVSGDLDLKEIYRNGIKKAFAETDYAKSSKKLPHYRFQWAILAGFIALMLETFFSKRRGFVWRAFSALARRRGAKATALAGCLACLGGNAMAANPFQLERADRAFSEGRYEDALKAYSELRQNDPNDPALEFGLGDSYYKLGKYEEAEGAFKNALNLPDPGDRKKALYNLGNTAYRSQKLDEALSYYEKALQIDPDYAQARSNYDFVKRMKEQKKQQEQKQKNQDQEPQQQDGQQDQQQQDQENKEEPKQENKNQENQNQESQKESDQDGQSEQQDEKQSEEDQKENGNESKNSESEEGRKEEEREKEQKKSEEQDADQRGDQGQSKQGSQKMTQGKYDQNADQWLDSVSDEPGQAMKYLIRKNSVEKTKRFDKDW